MSNVSSTVGGVARKPNAIIGALGYLKAQVKAEIRKRGWIKNRRRIIEQYFASDGPKMLQTGCGHNILRGWLNTDLNPEHDEVAYLDCTDHFPFDDAVFDYVFTEHQIEHIDYLAGQHMLRECLRVLKPGGKLRIATPNLTNILGLYTPNKTDAQLRYLRWSVDRFQKHIGIVSDTFVINHFFRSWGHKFIYDPPTMTAALENVGFAGIKQFRPGESDDPSLKRMETHGKSIESEEFNLFETMVLQAERPATAGQNLRTLSAAFNRLSADQAREREAQLQV